MSQDITVFTAGQFAASRAQGLEADEVNALRTAIFAVFVNERNQQKSYLEVCTGTAWSPRYEIQMSSRRGCQNM